jgi:hypothetical protein
MEGLISLGIYDHSGKLVRILHREATADEFVAAVDGFITHWDGLDDSNQPLPPGQYSASGYMVGSVTVRPVPTPPPVAIRPNATPASTSSTSSPSTPQPSPPLDTLASALPSLTFPTGRPFIPRQKIHAALVANPLDRDRTGSAELSVGFDAKASWLQLADGLPLKKISATPNLKWVALGRSAPAQPLVVFQSDGVTVEEFVITNISDMMSFDCGGFDFPETAR